MSILSTKQAQAITLLFAEARDEQSFDAGLAKMGLTGRLYENEIANLLFAIATNKPVSNSND